MADVSALSIIVPGVVTPIVVAAFAHFQERSRRRQAAVDELRVVVDQAARSLTEVGNALVVAMTARSQSADYADEYFTVIRGLGEVAHARDRMMIRVGRKHPAARTYDDAVGTFLKWAKVLGRPAFDASAARELQQASKDERIAFLDAATGLIGHDLLGRPSLRPFSASRR